MFRLKLAFALMALVLAKNTLSKSIKKKHSKKESIPKYKSHYVLLMGNPIEDEHNRKGLGMILSSKLRGESDKLNGEPSKGTHHHHHHHNKPGTDLAATLQTSSEGYPSDDGYSYTEALFTGAPLLNGTPVSESDRTQERDRNKGTGFAKLQADKSNDHTKEEDSVQIQKEVHTGEGVVGIAVNEKPKENQHFQTSPSSEVGKEVQKNTENYDANQQSSSNASPYNSKSERLENAKYTQIHEVSGDLSQMKHLKATPLSGNYKEANNHYQHRGKSAENPLSDRPVEQVHQILVTGKTQENFAGNVDGTGPFAGEEQVNNKLSDKINVKSYDEESNLLVSSVYNQGRFVEKQGYRVGGQQHHEFHSNITTGPTEYERPANSLHQPSMDELPKGVEPSEKESGTSPALSNGFGTNEEISKLGNKNIQLQSEFIPTSTAIDAENGKVDTSYEQLGRQPLHQNHEHTEGASGPPNMNNHANTGDQNSRVALESRKIPIEKTNESMTMPLQSSTQNEGDSRVDEFINQLRPHKIIESSFDQELTRKITTGPSQGESNHATPMQSAIPDNTFSVEKSEEHDSSNITPPSLPFREGSSPAESSNRNEDLTKDQREQSVEGSRTNPEASNTNHNEIETQQDISQQMFPASAVDAPPQHEDTSTNDSFPQKEQEETSQSSVEHERNKNEESSASSINSLGQASIPNGATNEISSSRPYGEGSISTAFSHQNKELPNDRSSEESEAMRQKGTLDKLPDHESTFANGVDSPQPQEALESSIAPGVDTNVASSDSSVKSQGHTENQREGDKEEQSSLSDREGSNPKMFGHENGELQQNVEQQPVEASISSSEAGSEAGEDFPLRSSQMEGTKQKDTSNGVSSTDSDNGANLNQEQQPVDSLQSSTEHQTATNFGSSDTSDQNESLEKEQRQQSDEALPPVSESNRVRPLSSSNMDSTTQSETSDHMLSSNKVDNKPDHEDRFINDASLHQEEQSMEISPSDAQSRPNTSEKPVESSQNSPRPTGLGYKPHEVNVGTPEEGNVMPVADNSKELIEGQKLMPFLGIRNDTREPSEERQNSQLNKENEHDNRNQKIVYFLKMAKGIPLLNSRKTTHYVEHRIDSTPERGPQVNGRRRYPWSWQYNLRRPNRPAWGQRLRRPRQGRRPRYRYRPTLAQPSPSPSPSIGGGGALGGSSTNSNEPQGDSDFEEEALKTHNKYRKTHGVPDMSLSRDLSNQAKAYAQKIANMGQLLHSSRAERGESVGENLAYACSSNGTPLTGESATKMWYDEVCKPGYRFPDGGFSSGTGHFTQVVWKDSTKLGIGQGKATQNGMPCIYVVGRYEIAGNMMGEFRDQVLRGNFNEEYCNNVKK